MDGMGRDETSDGADRTTAEGAVRLRLLDRIAGSVPDIAAVSVVLLAGMDLVRWSFGAELLTQIPFTGGGIMTPLTAVAVATSATALGLLRNEGGGRRWRRRAARLLAALVAVLGLVILGEYVLGVDAGIDLLLFPESVRRWNPPPPGRSSVMATIGFTATGLSLLILDVRGRVLRRVATVLLLGVGLLGLRSAAGYAYAVDGIYSADREGFGPALFPVMALHSALSFLALSLGALLARPDRALPRLLTGDDEGSFIARRLLPASIVVPLGLGYLGMLGVRAGLYSSYYGTSLIVVGMVVVLAFVTLWSASALRRLAAEQQRLNAILEATPDFVGMADADGRCLYVNAAGRRMVGIGDADVRDRVIRDFHPAWAFERLRREGIPTARRDGVWGGETALAGADGHEIPVSQVLIAHRGPDGGIRDFSTVMRDISDRKRREEAERFLLEASRTFSASLELDAVLESIRRLIVPRWADYCVIDVLAADGRIDRVSVEHADPAQRELANRLCAHSAGKTGHGVPEVVRTGRPDLAVDVNDAWIRSVTRDDEHFEIVRRLAPRSAMIVPFIARGRVVGALTFARTRPGRRYGRDDVALAEEFAGIAGLALDNARLFQESRAATGMRDRVLGVVAHDLRNPLNTISLSAELLRERGIAEDRASEQDRLGVIERSVAQANRLIQDLLDVARTETGEIPLERSPLDTHALVRETVALHQPIADQRSIRLETEMPESLDRIDADHDRILRVFANLIGNALKFSPEGGQIDISAEQRDRDIRFSIRDRGPGVPEEHRDKLFAAFWRGREGGGGGAGLGLTIARAIVEAHGGTIGVDTRTGEGSTFWFTVPAASAAAERSQAA